ncbi:MAG: sulfatase [Planctomycetota bacterium]|jgi:arylsulfatase A-like enzyme|nr:sulfatase [Planctomycetota bacterium]MDP7251922.1 sulfatase [Planctomycetota bacterium]
MNVILIISDTIRHDYLGCYGNDWVQTPHIDGLAQQAAVMENFFCASFPTGMARKDFHSGRFTFAYTNWGGERPDGEMVLAEMLQDAGVKTAMIGDTNNSQQYAQGFDHLEIVPSAASNLDQVPETVELPAAPEKLRFPMEYAQRIARNALGYASETDRRAARTMLAAHRWLESQSHDSKPFFLWVDTFDPHEPWDPPQYYIDLYDPGYEGDRLMEPAYQPSGYASEREIHHMRCMYAGKLTMVDRWTGFLLEGIERMGLADDTAVIFCSDHGFYHGEHGLIGKVHLDRENRIVGRWPLYSTISHPPLMLKIPGVTDGTRLSSFCHPPDVTPTILELLGVSIPAPLQGKSLLPVVQGESGSLRDFAVSTLTHITDEDVRCPASFRTDEYLYIYGGDEWPSELYDLKSDPDETNNIIDSCREAGRHLHERYLDFLRSIGCPEKTLEARSEFQPTPRTELPYRRLL